MGELEKMPLDRKKITKSIINNARNFMIVFILFVVVVVMSTDIRLVTATDVAALGLDFFLLLFCSYAMYVCCADSGARAGNASDVYKGAIYRFTTNKKRIIESTIHTRLRDFCTHYIGEDLKEARMQYLSVAGIEYQDYLVKYSNLDKESIEAIPDLSQSQKKAILKANKVRPVRLTPNMILRHGRNTHRRSPLEITPFARRNVIFGAKFVQMSIISICMSVIALDVIMKPSWVVFASVCLKLASVVINGFGGYKAGYDNIAVDTVNYLESQSDLMEQAIQYVEANPVSKETSENFCLNETTKETSKISLP